MKKILIVAATAVEIEPFRERLIRDFEQVENEVFERGNVQVRILVTGVGMLLTAVHLTRYLAHENVDLVINAGIAGAYHSDLNIGEVVAVISEQLGDVGAQERDGGFTDIFEMRFIAPNEFPFVNACLVNENPCQSLRLKEVKGLTVNKVHGEVHAIDFIRKKYQADIETMEGAAFLYICKTHKIPFTQIRAISNYVEPRNRENWNIGLAIKNLNEVLWRNVFAK